MVKKIANPTIIEVAGNKPKHIAEYIGRINSRTHEVSIAKMISPKGWVEPGQTPEFDEFTVVLKGTLKIRLIDQEIKVTAGEAIIVDKGEWIQYSTPYEGGAEYIAVCIPAFSPETVHRDPD